MDYVNEDGVAMEILHYEYDSHNLEEIHTIKDTEQKVFHLVLIEKSLRSLE